MEKELRFDLMLSLKEIAMRRVVVILCKQPDILGRFQNYSPYLLNVPRVESQMADKIYKLMCPEPLTREMLTLVTPFRLQIENWIHIHMFDSREDMFIPSHKTVLAKLCFTMAGTVDYGKTAEELIHCKVLELEEKYRLACLYCLEDCIPSLWEELPGEIKRKFYNEEDTIQFDKLDLQFCWPYILNGEQSKLDSITSKFYIYPTTFYQHAFKYAVQEGNKSATKYFWEKLTPGEKDACLARIEFELIEIHSWSPSSVWKTNECIFHNQPDVLCYLLSQMNREQQTEFFKKHCCFVLSCFLYWPIQDHFLKLADRIWAFLSAENIVRLLEQMNILLSKTKYCFAKLFRNFFPHCPVSFRKVIVERECQGPHILFQFFELEDSENIKIMFRNVSTADRRRLVSSVGFFLLLFKQDILISKSNMVKLCLQEATLSKEDREALEVEFMTFQRINSGLITQVRNPFFQLLDQAYGENKRSSEDENKAKRLCSNE